MENQQDVFKEATNIVIDTEKKTVKAEYNNRPYFIEYDKLYVFDDDPDHQVSGLPLPIQRTSDMCEVWDWWDSKSCMKHQFTHFEDPDSDFVKHIYFYLTQRLRSVGANIRDLVSVSYLTEKELEDEEFSEINVRFKTMETMLENGLKGQSSGAARNHRLNIQFALRDVNRLGVNLYDDIDDVEFHLYAKSRSIHRTEYSDQA